MVESFHFAFQSVQNFAMFIFLQGEKHTNAVIFFNGFLDTLKYYFSNKLETEIGRTWTWIVLSAFQWNKSVRIKHP